MFSSLFELLGQEKPIVVFGRDGQVGKALQLSLKDLTVPVVFLGRSDCDLSDEAAIREVLNRYQPQVIINAATYTSVDKAESERELAFAINAKAPAVMARYIANVAHGILVHYSTDYVFADTKITAYLENDAVGPGENLSAYGQSKLAGEQAIQEAFNSVDGLSDESAQQSRTDSRENELPKYFILRTSWVYGDGENFIRTMLRLAAEGDQLKVVADQVGVPTSADWLAETGLQMVVLAPHSDVVSGIYHAVPDGEVSWHGLAVFAIETAAVCGEGIEVKSENILPIPATHYPLPAPRPYNSRLNNKKMKKVLADSRFAGQYPQWQDQVSQYVSRIVKESLKS
jgi:dTDP-4-dehydrorhamnose reductase